MAQKVRSGYRCGNGSCAGPRARRPARGGRAGEIDTVLLALTDMQGRLQGKRLTASHFLDEVAEHGAEACNYLLAVDVEMNTVDGYAMSSWERGYGDFEMTPDLDTLRRSRGTRAPRCAWPTCTGATARRSSPRRARSCARQLDRLAERGLEAVRRAPSSSSWSSATPTSRRAHKGYRDLDAGQPLQRRLLAARHRARRAADPPHPQRDGRRRHAGRELQGRVQLRPARDQLPLRRRRSRPPTSTRSTRTAPRRSPPRRAWRSRSWPSTTSARATRATSTSRCAATTARRCSPTTTETFERFVAGQLACLRELTLLYAPNINSYKRFARGSFAPTAVAWGSDNRTCSLRVVGHGARRGGAAAAGRGREPVPGAERDDRRRAARHRRRARARARSRATPTPPTSRACPRTLRDALDAVRASASRATRSARRSSSTTSTTPRVELDAFEAAVTDWERVARLRAL